MTAPKPQQMQSRKERLKTSTVRRRWQGHRVRPHAPIEMSDSSMPGSPSRTLLARMNAHALGHALAIHDGAKVAVIDEHELVAIAHEGAMRARNAREARRASEARSRAVRSAAARRGHGAGSRSPEVSRPSRCSCGPRRTRSRRRPRRGRNRRPPNYQRRAAQRVGTSIKQHMRRQRRAHSRSAQALRARRQRQAPAVR